MRALALAVSCCIISTSCTSDTPTTPPAAPVEAPAPAAAPAGSPFAQPAWVHLALFGLPDQEFEPAATFEALRKERLPAFSSFDLESSDAPTAPSVFAMEPTIAEFPPPDAESLQFFSIGLEPAQTAALPSADRVFVTGWVIEAGPAGQAQLHEVMKLWGELATATGGVPWDDDTRQAFSASSWNEMRVDHWHEGTLPIDRHMTMHMYDNGGEIRLVTLGMGKVGLPDLTIPSIIRNDSNVMGPLVNATAQAMLEGAAIQSDGRLLLDLALLRHPELGEALRAYVLEGSAKAEIELSVATPQQGDADNRLWEIRFPGSGDSYHQAQIDLLEQMFGSSEDSVSYLEHDAELIAASEKSRAELMGMKSELRGQLDQGYALLVKGPFPTPDGGNEWMWVEVRGWSDDAFDGLLINEPVNIPELKYGMTVTVTEAEFFDYRLDKPDGSTMGWHATRLMAAREGMQIE